MGLCAALYNPSARRAARDSQSELHQQLGKCGVTENSCLNEQGREQLGEMHVHTYGPIHVPTQQTYVHGENMVSGDTADRFSACLVSTGHWVPFPQYYK